MPASPDRSPTAVRATERNILVVTSAAHFLVHLYMLVYPSLALALQADFELSLGAVLALSFWMYLLYGVGALPAGILADLIGSKPMLVLCLLGCGGCAVWASVGSAGNLPVALAGLGLFASIYHPCGMSLISQGVGRRGWALGINGVFGNLGVVFAPFLTGLLTATVGWRGTYLVLALPAIAVGLLAIRLPVRGPAVAPATASPGSNRRRRVYYFALLCIAMTLGGVAYRGQTLVLPAFFQERIDFLARLIEGLNWWPTFGTRTVTATFLTSVAYLAGVFGMMAGGSLADRKDLRKLYLLFHAVSVPLLLCLAYLADLPLLLCALAYSFFAFGMQPIENSLVAVLTPTSLRSTGYGLKFILTFGLGSVAVHLVGSWQAAGGLQAVFPRLAFCLVILLGFASWLSLATRHEPAAAFGRGTRKQGHD
jgi:MFS family permease